MSSTHLVDQASFLSKVIGESNSNDKSKCKSSIVVKRKVSAENGTQKSLLLYLVRMGSFQSPNPRMPSKPAEDDQDEDEILWINFKEIATIDQMKKYCLSRLPEAQSLLKRKFITKNWRDRDNGLSVMQWNMLSQALGSSYEKFETSSEEDMEWSTRKWKIVLELIQYDPIDIICLQEVDHFDFLMSVLSKLGYDGKFLAKPDSPCYYISDNTGPDGCAIFWQTEKLKLMSTSERILEVCQCPSNQVALCCKLQHVSGQEISVITTHLKARTGPILSTLRNEQGKDLINFLLDHCDSSPVILTGDFNAEPSEPVYSTVSQLLSSAYVDGLGQEPAFTNWTKRDGEPEKKRTLDYIFYSKEFLDVNALLMTEGKLKDAIPSAEYPSDHLSLVARFTLKQLQ